MCETEYVATRVQVHPRQLTFTTLPLIVNAETPTCQCCSGDQRAVTMVSLHMSTQRKSSIGTIQPLRIPLHFWLVATPLKNMKVSWDSYSQDMEK